MFERISGLPIKELVLVGWMPSGLKKWYYRRRGYKIDPTVQLALGAVIVADHVEIGPETRIGLLTIIKARTLKLGARVRVGHLSVLETYNLHIGEGSRIGNQVVVGGLATPSSALHIGYNCILMEWSFINTTLPVIVGNDVGIGGHCLFFTHGLWPNGFEGFPVNFGPIEIEDQAWLAWRVTVLPGVKIGAKSIISSDACVTKSIPALALAAGVPAKVLRENGSYIAEADLAKNRERLDRLLNEFCEWVTFHKGIVKERSSNRITLAYGKNCREIGRIIDADSISESDAILAEVRANDVVVSLSNLTPSVRSRIESQNGAWLDIAGKERSRTSHTLAEELEEFLRRSGLRMLKYERWPDKPL